MRLSHLSNWRSLLDKYFVHYIIICNSRSVSRSKVLYCIPHCCRTFQPRTFHPQASTPDFWTMNFSTPNFSTPDFSTPHFSTMNFSTPDFSTPYLGLKSPGLRSLGLKSSWLKSLGLKSLGLEGSCLKSPGLESSWLRSLGLKGLGLKLEVEKSGVEMSFNPLQNWRHVQYWVSAKNLINIKNKLLKYTLLGQNRPIKFNVSQIFWTN